MRYNTRFELKKLFGILRQSYGSLDPNFQLCDSCQYRRGTIERHDRNGRLVERAIFCKKCHRIKQQYV